MARVLLIQPSLLGISKMKRADDAVYLRILFVCYISVSDILWYSSFFSVESGCCNMLQKYIVVNAVLMSWFFALFGGGWWWCLVH